jgi:hypothetical protein
MKNKHLVLLFLSALAAGLLLREAPWRDTPFFQTKLMRADTSKIRQIVVARPGRPEMLFERAEGQWLCTQGAQTVPASAADVNAMLFFLNALNSLKIVKTARPDTLQLADNWELSATIQHSDAPDAVVYFGREVDFEGKPATHLRLNRGRDLFLVGGSAAAVFPLSIEPYRNKAVLPAPEHLEQLRELSVFYVDTIYVADAADTTLTPEFHKALQQWQTRLQGLNHCAPADFFDESKAQDRRFARIRFRACCPDRHFDLQLFRQHTPDMPDDPTIQERPVAAWPAYVLHSSYRPHAFFTLRDTAAVSQLLNLLRPFVHENRTQNDR